MMNCRNPLSKARRNAALLAGKTLTQLDALDLIPSAWVERVRNAHKDDEYLKRLANRITRSLPQTAP